jgi:hypothetical protein
MMPGLQEFIHKFEEGSGAVWIKRLFLFLALAGVAAFYDIREYKGWANREAMDMGQLARNISRGDGYTTQFIRPLSVKLMQMQKGERFNPLKEAHPDLANAPVYPVILAGVLKVAPITYEVPESGFMRYSPEVWIAIFNQILLGFLLWSLYVLGRKIFDSAVGLTTAAVVGLTEIIWRFSVSGLPTIFLMIITTWIVWCLADMEFRSRDTKHITREQQYFWVSVLLGVLLAVGTMTRYSFGWLLLPIVGFVAAFLGGRRGRTISIVVAILLVALGPWCFRNYSLSGRFFGIAGFAAVEQTLYFPENHMQRAMPQNLAYELNRIGINHFWKKLLEGAKSSMQKDIPALGGSWVMALFLVGLLAPFQNPGLGRLRYFILAAMAILIAAQSLGRTAISDESPEINSENLVILIAPLIYMFGVALFYAFLDQALFEFPQFRSVAVGAFIAVVSIPMIITCLPPKEYPLTYPPYYPPFSAKVSSWMRADELMMSDQPWSVAWYGDRTCMWTTLDAGNGPPYDFYAINDYLKPVKALMISPITMDRKFLSDFLNVRSQETAWTRFALDTMIRTNIPGGFPLTAAPTGFLPDFLVLTDRKRW